MGGKRSQNDEAATKEILDLGTLNQFEKEVSEDGRIQLAKYHINVSL